MFTHRRTKRISRRKGFRGISALLLAVLVLTGSSCYLESPGQDTGTLVLQLGNAASRNLFTTGNDLTGTLADDDAVEINAYTIVLRNTSSVSKAARRSMSYDTLEFHREAGTESTFIFDGLTPGDWNLEVEGWNDWDDSQQRVTGAQVAYLKEQETSGRRIIPFTLRRGEVETVDSAQALLVPIIGQEGDLEVSLDWSSPAVDERLAVGPAAQVQITQINNRFTYYPSQSWTEADTTDGFFQTKVMDVDAVNRTAAAAFTELPVGWYEVLVTLTTSDGREELQLKRMGFVRIVADRYRPIDHVTTSGTFTITDNASFATGSLELAIDEDLDPLTVSITQDSLEDYTHSDGFSGTASGSFSADAAGFAGGNSLLYSWYINGEKVTESTSSLTYSFTETGQYTVTVTVFEEDADGGGINFGTASHEVTVDVGEYQ